jgi:hypothetical protein
MKLTTKKIRLIIPALAILATAGAFAGIPSLRNTFSAKPAALPMPPVKDDKVDSSQAIILRELSTVLHQMDTLTILTIEGTITARDLADSSRNMQTTFCYSRNGTNAYYRMGKNEMLSLDDAYIAVSHDIHKVFLSPPRELINPLQLPVNTEADLLGKEGYSVTRMESEGVTRITLLNSIHAGCREYELTFDSTGWIKQTNMRVTDEKAPMDKKRDKYIGVTINSFQPGVVRKDLLRKDRFITIRNGITAPASTLQGYELIKDR